MGEGPLGTVHYSKRLLQAQLYQKIHRIFPICIICDSQRDKSVKYHQKLLGTGVILWPVQVIRICVWVQVVYEVDEVVEQLSTGGKGSLE
jgi:hypothetical protein